MRNFYCLLALRINLIMQRISILTILLFLFLTNSQSQTPESLLKKYNGLFPQEKVYMHFDNQHYMPGSLVGFKAYLMNGPEPSTLNRNFYTDWYDESGTLISHQVSPIALSSAFGTFIIPDNYKGNSIYVTAYTQWMLNFDTSFLFRKRITVLQSTIPKNNLSSKTKEYQLQFFPEGGTMVNGVSSFIAFKANDKNGNPIHISGILKNNKNDEFKSFKTVHDGMGKFAFIPEEGVTYTAEWTTPNGTIQYTALPAFANNGITMQLSATGSPRYMLVRRSENMPVEQRVLTMLVTVNQQVVLKGTVNLEKEISAQVKIPVQQLPSGIARITLMNRAQEPICERIIFIDNKEYAYSPQFKFDTIGIDKRAKNVIEIILPDSVPANLSMSVTNADIPNDTTENIISTLLLSSDIKGKIHNPAFYFSSQTDSTKYYLDLLMLTHGWRKFVWKKVLDTTSWKIKYPLDTAYLTLSGNIEGVNEKRLAKAETMNLILRGKDSTTNMYFVPVSKTGYFNVSNVIFFDTVTLFHQLNKIPILPGRGKVNFKTSLIDSAYYRSIQPPKIFQYDTSALRVMREIKEQQLRLQKLRAGTTLEEVVVRTRVKSRMEEMDEIYTNGLFRGADAISFDMINDPRALSSFSVFDYLQGRVAGLQIVGALTNNPSASWRGSPVSFFLNEMPIDAQFMATLPMTDVAYVKLFRPPFIGSLANSGGGAVSVYTKKGNDVINTVNGLDNRLLAGYTAVREFYQPDYSIEETNFLKTDTRRTLYWNPNIVTDGLERKVRVRFYNNDISRKLMIVLEGVNSNGQFISVRKLLE